MQNGGWYAKVALLGASVGAAMELFMIQTGFYEKVVDIEAQRRAEELQAAKEQLDASGVLQRQEPSFASSGDSTATTTATTTTTPVGPS